MLASPYSTNMESSKTIILLVLAAVAQSSCAQTQSAVYGLSGEQSVNFNRIVDTQNSAISVTQDALNPIFDVLERLFALRTYNLQCANLDYSPFIERGFVNAKSAAEMAFKTSFLILGESSSVGVERYLTAAYGDIDNVYNVQIKGAIELALSGNYVDLRAKFEPFYTGGRSALQSLMGRIYEAVRLCVSNNNADTLAEIEARQVYATKLFLQSWDAVFDAVRVLAFGIRDTSDVGIVHDISYYRQQAAFAMRDTVESIYTPYRGLYISNRLNKPELASSLISDQNAQALSANRYQAATKLIFDVIRSFLSKFLLGLSDAHDVDFSAIDAAQAKSSEYFKAALRALASSIPAKDPVSQTAIQTALKFFETFSEASSAAYFGAIRLALDQGSNLVDTVAKIEAAKLAFVAGFPAFVTTIFGLILLGGGNGAGSSNLQEDALQAGQRYVNSIFEAAEIVAKACHGGKVSDADFAAIDAAEGAANTAIGVFTSSISFGHVSVIRTFTAVVSGITSGIQSMTGSLIPLPYMPGGGGKGGLVNSFFG